MSNAIYQGFNNADLSREYSPSSCVADINVYLQQYTSLSKQAKALAMANNTLIENLRYGSNDDELLDLFLPTDAANAKGKLQVYIHGGYWQELTKEESCFAATNFQHHGYHFAVINYSLAPKVTVTEIVQQINHAVSWLYQHAEQYGYDAEQIYLSGSSAGAHLAVMAALSIGSHGSASKTSFIKGVCAVSGIYDLTPIAFTYINDALSLTAHEVQQLSPLLSEITSESLTATQFIVAYGDNETSEFKRQSDDFYHHLPLALTKTLIANITDKNHFDVISTLADKESTLFTNVLSQMHD